MVPVPGGNAADAGVELLIAAADRDDSRPIWYGNGGRNSGSTSHLLRAFDEVKQKRSAVRVRRVCSKVPHLYLGRPRPHAAGNRDNTASRCDNLLPNDFRARLDWCVAKDFAKANHAPFVNCQNDDTKDVLRLTATPGAELTLDAAGTSDPDGDKLTRGWFVCPVPDTYHGEVAVEDSMTSKATLEVPTNARGKLLHVILQVSDGGTPSLARYRRIVLECR
ncbi:hypothetical protein [Rubripirellula reticaptiva]|uniref:Cellulose-binding Sde182 C-terminal domain-containing protein n=1 Tax=Rubripirellula reticaptiva TaxID=2528013 RepID=A0A5C6EJV4_9BACT|nr:hypothetical protein [Rubripirellula reticaptiva]TWU49098.1 hypothetical protein Poly59_37110 [Rubripirellula reticaptiva]